jgi:hypothetical protein
VLRLGHDPKRGKPVPEVLELSQALHGQPFTTAQ